MRQSQLSLLPAGKFVALVPELRRHLALVAESITAQNFASILDESMRRLIAVTFDQISASEGSIWLHDNSDSSLVIALNTGPNAEKLVGHFRQPLSAGIVSMVFSSEQSFVENEVYKNSQQDKSLDSMLNLRTESMIATPFYFLAECRGVITGVQLQASDTTEQALFSGFSQRDLAAVRHLAALLGRLVDDAVLRAVVGLR